MKNLNLQVGQTWLRENGSTTKIVITVPGICAFGDESIRYSFDGECSGYSGLNLVSLCESIEDAQEKSVNDAVSALMGGTFTNAATVGDINSTAKGSGARYNAGKPPFDLVPLQMMSEYYSVLEAGAESYFDPILALSALGEFQAGGDGEDLLDVLGNLGDGWEECANVFGYGQKKYAAWNWCRGMAWSVPIACAARHLRAMIGGETLDPESGLPHRGHVYCNVAMVYTFIETYAEGDDRAPAGSLMLDLDDADDALHFDQSK